MQKKENETTVKFNIPKDGTVDTNASSCNLTTSADEQRLVVNFDNDTDNLVVKKVEIDFERTDDKKKYFIKTWKVDINAGILSHFPTGFTNIYKNFYVTD